MSNPVEELFGSKGSGDVKPSAPIRSLRIDTSNTNHQHQLATLQTQIKLICTREYTNVSKIPEHDHLMDKNLHKWREQMKRVFISCDITNYITGRVIHPDITVDPINANN